MRKLLFYCLLASLCPAASTCAQSPPAAVRPLSIGDTVPDIAFTHLVNYKSATAKLSDFKGRLVILDFWSSWCGNCIRLFPYMDSLQQAFKGQVQVILVNTKSRASKDDSQKISRILRQVGQK